jgi:hypothetical protein
MSLWLIGGFLFVGAGLLAMNDDAVCLENRGAWIASKPAPTRFGRM